MTMRMNPQGYESTKKEQADNNINNFDYRVEKSLDYLNAGFTDERQFIMEIKVAHSIYKHNQRRINELEG